MKTEFSKMVDRLATKTLDGPGKVTAALRREVATYAAAPEPGNEHIPPVLMQYLTKVAMHSYRVTDADIARLKAAGYSEDELYELTVSAAFGAGLARLNHGLALLNN